MVADPAAGADVARRTWLVFQFLAQVADVDLEAAGRVVNALLIVLGDAQLLPYLNSYYQLYDDEMSQERILAACLGLVMHGLGKEP